MAIHSTAVIDPRADLGVDVQIGAYAVIGPGVVIHDHVEIMHHAVVEGHTQVGEGTRCFPFSMVGGEPQDRKYRGEPTHLVIGRNNVFREGVTVHRGTVGGGGTTRIGDDNFFLNHSHVAHDCVVGNGCVFSNPAAIAGHVEVYDHAILGGMAGIHQKARVGTRAMVGAGAMAAQDVPPFSIVQGDRARIYGVNLTGLRRARFPSSTIDALRQAFRILFQQGLPMSAALERLEGTAPDVPEVHLLLAFIRASRRGICRSADPSRD